MIANAAVLLFALMFGWSAWHTVIFNRDFGTYSTGYLETPMWIVQAPMIAGAAFLSLAALVRMLRVMKGEAK
jgi:TRAP-type C4-dicarboxylate transport system permease small subunit